MLLNVDNLIEKLNEQLPPQIRVIGKLTFSTLGEFRCRIDDILFCFPEKGFDISCKFLLGRQFA